VRIDFWGDEIDLIGHFDIVSQRRSENSESVRIIPCKEIIASENSKILIRREINNLISSFVGPEKRRQTLLAEREAVENGTKSIFADKYYSLIYSQNKTLLDSLQDTVNFVFETKRIFR
jgi:transcription-repair coupling factor (superfamily II helicase)